MGKEKVHLLNLPERDSRSLHRKHAAQVAGELEIELGRMDISELLESLGAYGLLPIGRLPTSAMREAVVRLGRAMLGLDEQKDILQARLHPPARSLIARGNAYAMAKHRLRMVVAYMRAEVANSMVAGAANRTEYLTGTFSKWGVDHCADVMPILHLYRSQVEVLARYLEIPEGIREKAADPDILPGVNDKEALLGSFETTDQILFGLEHEKDRAQLTARFGEDAVEHIAQLRQLSRPMRSVPYQLPRAG